MNTFYKYCSRTLGFAALLAVTLVSGCLDSGGGSSTSASTPTVTETSPADTAIAVSLNRKVIATFSEKMDATSIGPARFTVQGAGEAAMVGTVSYDATSKTAIFAPNSNFTASTVYTVTINSGIESAAGVALASNYVWTFTSGTSVDNTAPTVLTTTPVSAATDVVLGISVIANFSEAILPSTVNSTTFTLKQGTTAVSGTVSYSDKVATFTPASNLTASTVYTATLTTGITDLTGNVMASNLVWSFTTGTTAAALGPDPVNLKTAGNFVILTKTGITNVPTSAVTGNIGASPITSSSIKVTCVEMQGTSKVYGADAAYGSTQPCFKGTSDDITLVADAVLDMGTAYTDAAGRTTPDFTELGGGEIGSLTLAPGLYKWGTGVTISTSVTFNGGANDVWILQVAGDITQAGTASVTLTGGALAKNIFWQVGGGTGVTLNSGANFKGIVLAVKGITLVTGATVNGRLLAQTAVVLDKNTVTQP